MDLAFSNTLRRADSALDVTAAAGGTGEPVEAFHRFGLGGREIATGRSDLVDVVVGRACQLAASEFAPTLPGEQRQIAVVALGGYGRRELAPRSDVDLLFLHADRADEEAQRITDALISWRIRSGARPRRGSDVRRRRDVLRSSEPVTARTLRPTPSAIPRPPSPTKSPRPSSPHR